MARAWPGKEYPAQLREILADWNHGEARFLQCLQSFITALDSILPKPLLRIIRSLGEC